MLETISIITLVEGALLFLFCCYLTYEYANRETTPGFVLVLCTLGWLLGFMIILLIPLDIYSVSDARFLN